VLGVVSQRLGRELDLSLVMAAKAARVLRAYSAVAFGHLVAAVAGVGGQSAL